jgi:hypothetical protein
MTEPGRDDKRAGASTPSRLIDDPSHSLCRRRNHHEFGNERQLVEPRHRGKAVDLRVARVHQAEFSGKRRLADITENGPADRSLPRAGANQRDGTRQKQIFQTIGRHRSRYPAGAGPL